MLAGVRRAEVVTDTPVISFAVVRECAQAEDGLPTARPRSNGPAARWDASPRTRRARVVVTCDREPLRAVHVPCQEFQRPF